MILPALRSTDLSQEDRAFKLLVSSRHVIGRDRAFWQPRPSPILAQEPRFYGPFNSSLEGNARRAIDIHEGEKLDGRAFKALIKNAVALNASS
jgi:hypothetical protein